MFQYRWLNPSTYIKWGNRRIVDSQLAAVSSTLFSEVHKALSPILSPSSPRSGDWVMAPSITAIRLRLSDEMIRFAAGFRVRLHTREPHTCPCGKEVEARGLRGLSYRQSTARQQRRTDLNNIIWRAIKRAQILVVSRFYKNGRETLRRCNANSVISWQTVGLRCNCVTVPDMVGESHLKETSILAGAAGKQSRKTQTHEVHVHNFRTHICTTCNRDV